MTAGNIFAYCVALFIMAAIPGPGVMSLVGSALGSGFKSTIPMAVGLIAGDLTFMTAVVLGLTVVLGNFTLGFIVLKALSAIYILYLAKKLYSTEFVFRPVDGVSTVSSGQAFMTGYLVTMGNPKCMIFYLSLLPTLLPIGRISFNDYLLIASLTAGVLAITVTPYIALAARIRQGGDRPGSFKAIRTIAAAIMAAAAVMVLWELVKNSA